MNAQTKIEMPEGLALLRQPFPPHQISKLPKGGVMLDYVGHAALTDRLLDADPEWDWQPLALDADGLPKFDADGGLWIRLIVCGKTRLGYGDAGGKKGPNAKKEAIGDALRNAAMRFGAALDLWHKGDLHADEPEPIVEHPMISGEQRDLIQTLAPAAGKTVQGICEAYKVTALTDLRASQAESIINRLRSEQKEPANA